MNGSPVPAMPVEMLGLLFALAAEPRPAAGDTELSVEFLEYLSEMDTAPSWVHDNSDVPPATDAKPAAPPPSVPRQRGAGERRP